MVRQQEEVNSTMNVLGQSITLPAWKEIHDKIEFISI
jgi:hypothetical protein